MTPTPDIDRLRELVKRANERVGGISIDRMEGDNLAIVLCSHFDNPDQEEDENGWSEAATAGYEETIQAIRAHYQPAFDALLAQLEASEKHRNDLYDKVQDQITEIGALKARIAQHDADRAADKARIAELEGVLECERQKVAWPAMYQRYWDCLAQIKVLEGALGNLESACDRVAATRGRETYLRMIDHDKAEDALEELDEARRAARSALNSHADGASPSKETAA